VPETRHGGADIRSEQRGVHWIAWRADAAGKPEAAVVIVGETREEAEAHAAQWWEGNQR
jgi:hypothetical protein